MKDKNHTCLTKCAHMSLHLLLLKSSMGQWIYLQPWVRIPTEHITYGQIFNKRIVFYTLTFPIRNCFSSCNGKNMFHCVLRLGDVCVN